MQTSRVIPAAICLTAWTLLGAPALACQVPVFRYALENWEPDRLTVAVLHAGEPDESLQQALDVLEASRQADDQVNLQVHRIDVTADHPEGSPEAYYANRWKDAELPHALVFFANDAPEPHLAWSGKLDNASAQALVGSPVRQQVTQRLLEGESAVWVLLKSGDETADRRAEQTLRDELAKKPQEIELPSLKDLEGEEKFNELLPVEMRVAFSLITIEPDTKDEQVLREMLLNTERDLKEFAEEPIAIPIYGRGRTYFALVGAGINADNIADNCHFICGACSCEVKRDNPGQDLLLAANWNRVQPGNWVNDTPLPALTGIGGFETMTEIGEDDATLETGAAEETLVARKEDPSPAQLTSIPSDPQPGASSESEFAAETPSAEETVASSAAPVDEEAGQQDVWLFVLGWGGALLGLGVIFTLWRRSKVTD